MISSAAIQRLFDELIEIASNDVSLIEFRTSASERLERALGFDGALWTPASVPTASGQDVLGWRISSDFIVGRSQLPTIAESANAHVERALSIGKFAIDGGATAAEKRTSPFFHEIVRPTGTRSFIAGPLGKRPRSFLTITRSGKAFTREDVRFVDAISSVLANCDELCALRKKRMRRTFDLTPRERSIADLVERGLTNAEIAGALQISKNTVRNRLANAFERMDVSNRAELVARLRDDDDSNGSA